MSERRDHDERDVRAAARGSDDAERPRDDARNQDVDTRTPTRCFQCGYPSTAERCPRCGAIKPTIGACTGACVNCGIAKCIGTKEPED